MYDQPLTSGGAGLAGDGAGLAGDLREEIWLLGQPRLQDYLDFMRKNAIDSAEPRALCDEWRSANDYYYELERSEAGIADQMESRDPDAVLIPLLEELMANSRFRRAFDRFPTDVRMVELDRLIVYQSHVTRQFVDTLQGRLGPAPSPEALFRFCLPRGDAGAAVRIRRAGSRRFVFSSESTDFRFIEAVLLNPEQVHDLASCGPSSGIIGLAVGFGSNFLNAVHSDNRFVLHNGYHRACALRALGIKYAPCVVETVTRLDELAITAAQTVIDAPAFYFKAARPPLLKDFFDPKIRKIVPVRRKNTIVEVSWQVKEYRMED